MNAKFLLAFAVTGSVWLSACNSSTKHDENTTDTASVATNDTTAVLTETASLNKLTSEEESQGFKLLFDGQSTAGWHSYLKGDSVIGWKAEGGILVCPGNTGADLTSNDEYENFELRFDWNVEPKGNSGVIYKVIEDKKYKSSYESGPEYQIIDDNGYPPYMENGKEIHITDKQKSGANYDMQAPSAFKAKAPGEWNEAVIIVNKNHVEHWLNGEKVVEYEYGGPEWKKQLAVSKFTKWPYATPHAKGKIAFQDHEHKVEYRNIRIKIL
ncbi:DUF1080 domain-containing protein [Xanthocytophaga agilis]|uniref:DUF1080 domain-containing protein n=1 Tax=Xanthocytophaga agilis TaxID=3048010 RepID=A0AAE3QX78_9BACT|nr:DUF1080 domain-containing protein [Xanthocytophaga agilis]MDJ1499721.1 DUF1080 domain-containing protein [Xanthocytophaga agilis]